MLVAIGFAEALSAPEVVWSLVDAGHTVIAFARRGRRSALDYSRHVRVLTLAAPERDATAARSELKRELTRLAEDNARSTCVLLPLDDASLWLFSQVDDPRWQHAGALGTCAEFALDKERQVLAARDAGFAVPPTTFVRSSAELPAMTPDFPTILRPVAATKLADNRLQKGSNWICADAKELTRAIEQGAGNTPLMRQPYIRGNGEGVFGFATSAGVVAWSGHERLRMMNPHGSGSSACRSRTVDALTRACGENLVRSIQWRGLFMIELLRDRNGTLWFVEFNGRPWGSLALARRQGLEYPAWAVAQAADPGFIPQAGSTNESLVCRNLGREFMHVLFVLRGPKSRAVQNWPSRWRTLRDVVPRPGDSLYNWRADDWRVFAMDAWSTVRSNLRKNR